MASFMLAWTKIVRRLTRSAFDMEALRQIGPVRRTYNQWVANQTLEDYALRFTAVSARRWSVFRVANTAIGGISFLALEAIGAAITFTFGFENAVWAILAVSGIIFLLGLPISFYAARFGVDIDLLTRGAGFGYLGSTITSLIYASFTFIFFALEAAIMAKALKLSLGLPEALGFLVSSLVVIPLVTHGFTAISRFQLWTQPLWIVLHVTPFVVLFFFDDGTLRAWTGFTGRLGAVGGAFEPLLFGAASGVLFALVAQIGEQVDFLRFLPERRGSRDGRWWAALIMAGPGWIVLGALKLLAGSFLSYLAFRAGVPPEDAAEPTHMYMVAFSRVTGDPAAGLVVAAIFVVISQLKINVTNAYAGSIAWSNFFSRLTHSHPGRVVWVVFNVMIALLLMQVGIYRSLEAILGLYSHVAIAWVGAIVADLVISKPLGLSPAGIEFKRAHLYDINPAGLGAMLGATVLAIAAHLGLFGAGAAAFSSYLALVASLVLEPLIAVATRSRFYLARAPRAAVRLEPTCTCTICMNRFEAQDMASCPVYDGSICSLCCTLDMRCRDLCKRDSRVGDQIVELARKAGLADRLRALPTALARYLVLQGSVSVIMASVMALVYWEGLANLPIHGSVPALALVKAFLGLFLITGIVSWLFVLTHESREMAQAESERQTSLLIAEVAAHDETDRQLQAAKEVAEAANLAKSRYLVGISHEFRTPLNAILGYAQLLQSGDLPAPRHGAAVRTIRRSGEHLAGLVDGLLDIARIEAGRFELHRDTINFPVFLEEIIDMFQLQAESKGVGFVFDGPPSVPAFIRADEKRLRQVLINLLSNAVKFTEKGEVRVSLRLRNEVATITVADTGIGIAEADLERIFVPFERIENRSGPWVPGTGLGLTLTRLMTEMMGGSIRVESRLGEGSRFTLQLHLPATTNARTDVPSLPRIIGYEGPRRTILVVDDEASHRAFLSDLLVPLGFNVVEAASGPEGLARLDEIGPALCLLDITMPGMDGRAVAAALRREHDYRGGIILLSAAAVPERPEAADDAAHDAFLGKPVRMDRLLAAIRDLCGLEWIHAGVREPTVTAAPRRVPEAILSELRNLADLGLPHAFQRRVGELQAAFPGDSAFWNALAHHAELMDFEAALAIINQHAEAHDTVA